MMQKSKKFANRYVQLVTYGGARSIKFGLTKLQFEGRDLRGLEQNPNAKSRWAVMAQKGQKVIQFFWKVGDIWL
jgi:hypothetical protein